MTFKLKDFTPGDIVRDTSDEIVEIVAVGPERLYGKYSNGEIYPLAPLHVVEIVEVMVGERKIGV